MLQMCAAPLDGSLGSLDWLTVKNAEAASAVDTFQHPGQVSELTQTHKPGTSASPPNAAGAEIIDCSSEDSAAPEEAGCDEVDLNILLKSDSSKTEKEENSNNRTSWTYGQDGKPNLSYAELIKKAIEASTSKKMTLNEIYRWIMEKFPYYRDNDSTSWKNSIRHNLSLNKQFKKILRERGDPGKGSYWRIDDTTPDTWRARRPRSYANPCPWHNGSSNDHIRCPSSNSMGRCSNESNTPRVNPVIQALFGITSQQQEKPNHGVLKNEMSGSNSFEYRHQDSLASAPESQCPSVMDAYGSSWGSQTSSVPSNFHFPDLDSSVGSVQSQLSESFKNLYQQALNASFNNTAAPGAFQPVTGSVQAASQQDPMNQNRMSQLMVSVDQPVTSHQQFTPSSFQVPGAAMQQQGSFSSIDFQERAADWIRQAAAESQGQSAAIPQEMLIHNLDMDQFQNMMGSMQSRDLQELLGNYSGDLAASWKDFLTRSIGGGSSGFTMGQSQQAQIWKQWQVASQSRVEADNSALAPTPPAVSSIEQSTESIQVESEDDFTTTKDLVQFGLIPNDQSQNLPPGMSRKGNPLLSSVKEESDSEMTAQQKSLSNQDLVKNEPLEEEDSGSDFDWEDLVNRN